MGKSKKYYTKTINFGREESPVRILVEKYNNIHGKNKLSELVRKAVYVYLCDTPETTDWKIKALLIKRKEIGEKLGEMAKKRYDIEEQLKDLGIDPDTEKPINKN